MTIDLRFSPIERDNFYNRSAYSWTALMTMSWNIINIMQNDY
jgi:hypothetical protein